MIDPFGYDPFGYAPAKESGVSPVRLFSVATGKGTRPVAVDPVVVDDVLVSGDYTDAPGYAGGVPDWNWPEDASGANLTVESRLYPPSSEEDGTPEDDLRETWRTHYEPGRPLSFYCSKNSTDPTDSTDRAGTFEAALGLCEAVFEENPLGGSPFGARVVDEDYGVSVDYRTPDALWARVGRPSSAFRVVVERGDWPRFALPAGSTFFSEVPVRSDDPELPNVYLLGTSGFAIAASRTFGIFSTRVETYAETWFMLCRANRQDMLAASGRVMLLKVYDGPYPYSARGTDIKLADPAPLPSEAEYAFYSYDEAGLRGIYRERHDGIRPQKKAITIESGELLERAETITGDLYYPEGSDGTEGFTGAALVGSGTLTYRLPLHATKIKSIFTRGAEVSVKASYDGTPLTDYRTIEDYDGLATDELLLEVNVLNSLSSVRVEYECIEDWRPVGRPLVDLAVEGTGEGTRVVVSGRPGEGLSQEVALPSGDYTVSVNARVRRGRAVVGAGGFEIVSFDALDKSIRAGGAFICERGIYEVVLTGLASETDGTFSVEFDRVRIATGQDDSWASGEISYTFEGEGSGGAVASVVDATGSVNRPQVATAPPPGNRWRLRVDAPESMGSPVGEDGVGVERDALLDSVRVQLTSTGNSTYQRTLRYESEYEGGDGGVNEDGNAGDPGRVPPRIYYPESLVNRPDAPYYEISSGSGGLRWTLGSLTDSGDVRLTVEGAPLAYPVRDSREDGSGDSGFFYLPATLSGGVWRVEIGEGEARVYSGDAFAGRMRGVGLPFRVSVENTEDVRLDCPEGTVQLRRGHGPRFEGWSLEYADVPAKESGAVTAFGTSESEAAANLNFVAVRLASG